MKKAKIILISGMLCILTILPSNANSLTTYQVKTEKANMEQIKGSARVSNEIYEDINPQMEICKRYGFQYNLIKAIGIVETGLDYSAVGDQGRSKGAFQIQDAIWSKVYGNLNLFDEVESWEACCKVCRYLLDEYGNYEMMLNAYNTGNPNDYNGYSMEVLEVWESLTSSDTTE